MKGNLIRKMTFMMILFLFISPLVMSDNVGAANEKTHVYDFAELLTDDEVNQLETLSKQLSAERETDFVILTTKDPAVKDVTKYMKDFYDEKGLGFDKPHGNTAILTIDMQGRDVDLAGFYKAEKYLDNKRLNLIRKEITPYLSDAQYFKAAEQFIELGHRYMGYKPGVNPENILFKWYFQVIIALVVAGIVVLVLAYRSSGRVTVNDRTYMDNKTSRVINRDDTYVRTTVTKVKKPSSNTSGGGGGGMTGGGHSHSGSRGSF